jgi:hypothetical protein
MATIVLVADGGVIRVMLRMASATQCRDSVASTILNRQCDVKLSALCLPGEQAHPRRASDLTQRAVGADPICCQRANGNAWVDQCLCGRRGDPLGELGQTGP